MKIEDLTVGSAHQGLVKKEFSTVELIKAVFSRLEKVEPQISAFITLNKEEALIQAQAVDKKISQSQEISFLEGIPAGIKDNIVTYGVKTMAGSRILENYIPPYDATVIRRLREAGMVLVGKTNLDEFAMGSSTENSAFFKTKNPWDFKRVPGGSSGGSAAAVAASECLYALGSDTAGSVRQPAAFCGVVGLKPSYGRVSRFGLIAMASSLDQIGPITRTVEDAAYVLAQIAGIDPQDSTTVKKPVLDYSKFLNKDIKGIKIGIPKEYFREGMNKGVEKLVKGAASQLEKLGAKILEVNLPRTEYSLAAYHLIMDSEVSANLARFDGIRYGYSVRDSDKIRNLEEVYQVSREEGLGSETKRRIMLGTYALSRGYYDQYYLKAKKVQVLIKKDFDKVFEKVDCLITPTTPTTAFKLGEKFEDPLVMYLSDIFTVPVNLTGLPAISVPGGFDNNLPVGFQIIGKYFDEGTILQVASAYEKENNWLAQKPSL